jgi:hypothetical protein
MTTDPPPDAAERIKVALSIADYVTTASDFGSWTPRRAAYEAVMVVLEDEGAAYDVLRCFLDRHAYDLAVVQVGDVPPWMERVELEWEDVGPALVRTVPYDTTDVYAIKEHNT